MDFLCELYYDAQIHEHQVKLIWSILLSYTLFLSDQFLI